MGKLITSGSNVGKTIKNIADYLLAAGLTDIAENISQYLQDGNFETAEWFVINIIQANGFTPFPDTGSGTTIYINPSKLPPVGVEWKLDDPTTIEYKSALALLQLLIHEKFHAEQQGWTDRLWYLMEIPNFFLFWLDKYNPMETTAYKHTVSILDDLADSKIAAAIQISQSVPLFGHHFAIIDKLMHEVKEIVEAKYWEVRYHNRRFRPDIPMDKLNDARNKIQNLILRLPPQTAVPVFIQEVLQIQTVLNLFEVDMANS